MWFLHCNCFVPIYYLSRKPNVIRLGYVFVVSLSKCRCVVSVCLSDLPVYWIPYYLNPLHDSDKIVTHLISIAGDF